MFWLLGGIGGFCEESSLACRLQAAERVPCVEVRIIPGVGKRAVAGGSVIPHEKSLDVSAGSSIDPARYWAFWLQANTLGGGVRLGGFPQLAIGGAK
jgi:hypothetical protein